MANDNKREAHAKWNCKYHKVIAPKYRGKICFGEKWIEIIEAEVCPDHVHMLVSIPPKIAVSRFMGYLKGKSSLIF